ncbi:hypothetical protein FHX45_000679 [Amycolatopsis granulosa]|nr:hypothetical protein [Amycolatopsis granulosa]
MSRKNRKNRTAPAIDERHLHALDDGPGQQNTATTTDDKVRAPPRARLTMLWSR